MAQSEDESIDGNAVDETEKTGGDSGDDLPLFKRRRLMDSPLPDGADSSQPLQEEAAAASAAAADATAFSFSETRQAGGDVGSMDDSLMALLLPDGLTAAEASAIPSEQQEDPSANSSSSISRRAASSPFSDMSAVQMNNPQGSSLSLGAADAAENHPVHVQNVIASGRITVAGRSSAALDLRRIAVSCRFAEYNPRKVNACIVRLRKPKCTGMIFRSGRLMVTGAQSEDAALRAARLLVKMLQAIFCPSSTSGGAPSRLPALSLQEMNAGGAPEGTGTEPGGAIVLASDLGAPSSAKDTTAADGDSSVRGTETAIEVAEGSKQQGRAELSVVAAKNACHTPSSLSSLSKRSFSNIQLTEFAVENIVATADCGLPVRLEGLAFDHKEFCSYEPELFAGLVYRYNPTPSLKAVLLIFVSGKVVITGCRTTAEIREVFNSFFPVLLKYHT